MVRLASPVVRFIATAAMSCAASMAAAGDPCIDGCRGAENSCRMAAKSLSPMHCMEQLQVCSDACLAAGMAARKSRGGGREFGGPRDFGGPGGGPHFGGGFRDRR